MLHNSFTFLMKLLVIGKVRELSHQAIDEVLKINRRNTMNKNIKLAVAGAVLALTASAANAGIVIPAGDWTLDVSGNVNAYTTWVKTEGNNAMTSKSITADAGKAGNTGNTRNMLSNGLLPNFLSIGGSTRQNDLDVAFTISIQPGSSHYTALGVGADGGINNRQAFITFGDKSWGSVLIGKNLGIFASDAILNDMTLLGVGASAGNPGNTTLGRIGYGYIYADWKPQISYTTPNMNGFQATVGISQNFVSTSQTASATSITASVVNAAPAYEGKASYSFAANDVTGKVWVSGIAQKTGSFAGFSVDETIAYGGDIGANVNFSGLGLTGYYYGGSGIGHQGQGWDGYGLNTATSLKQRDSDGGYVQATYVLPTKTKVGVSWGVSNLDKSGGASEVATLLKSNEMWTAGVYHPLTKHLNLVAEYSHVTSENHQSAENTNDLGSLGAILFF